MAEKRGQGTPTCIKTRFPDPRRREGSVFPSLSLSPLHHRVRELFHMDEPLRRARAHQRQHF